MLNPDTLREIADGLYERAEEIEEEQEPDPPVEEGDVFISSDKQPLKVVNIVPEKKTVEAAYMTGFRHYFSFKELRLDRNFRILDPEESPIVRALLRSYEILDV